MEYMGWIIGCIFAIVVGLINGVIINKRNKR